MVLELKQNENCQWYREKLKSDPKKWEAFKEKERLRGNKYRKTIKPNQKSLQLGTVKKAMLKQQNKERQRICRERKNISINDEPLPYKIKQTLFKAVSKADKALPSNLIRKRAVILQLLTKYDSMSANILNSHHPQIIKANGIDKVKEFYLRDDITYKSPGKSDSIAVKVPGNNKKIIMQKCYLQMTLSEAYALYKSEINDFVGKSKFIQLRPPNVKLVRTIPHNVCVCQMHTNFARMCESLKHVNGFPKSYQQVLEEMCCDIFEEKCMTDRCLDCSTSIKDIMPLQFDDQHYITWKQWKKNISTGRVKLENFEGTYCPLRV